MSAPSARPVVAMVQAWVPQYRQGFHTGLRDALAGRGIEFMLIHGYPHGAAATKQDGMTIPWARIADHRVLKLGPRELTWQPCVRLTRHADLVIADQASARLHNYALFARHIVRGQRFAFWGHGRNFQAHGASRVGEAVKRWISRHVDWWFAYNEVSAAAVRDLGFPAERISNTQNAIDTAHLLKAKAEIDEARLIELRAELGLVGANVAAYIGGMYPEKRLEFLFAACDEIRRQIPDFEMLFIGSGAQAELVREHAESREWVRYLGPRFGEEKVAYLMLAKLLLMPGLVGLAILDSFALETPIVTLADSEHSPEIEYLVSGENGVMLPAGSTQTDYAAEVARLLSDDAARGRLAEGGRRASETYTMEAMIARFADGVEQALGA